MIFKRVLTGWTFTRMVYTAVGLYIVVQAISDREWAFLPLGLYFASMGVFAFGCAGGYCGVPAKSVPDAENGQVTFEELNQQ
ncbi:MAG: hypothetical protein KDC49_05770 [Saprospiraceae bacterium]|nr:hypothetical protein [Saprospiraceae bacterium]